MKRLLAALGLALPVLALADAGAAANTGDTALVLVSAGLVMLMTPGLAFFYGGLVRSKNVVHTMNLSIVCMAIVGVLWALAGYSIAFSPGPGGLDRVIGGLRWLGLTGVGDRPEPSLAATVPHSAFMLFQAMFAVITPALISGAIVERMRIKAYVLFVALWSLVVYAPVAHWVWAPGGWLRNLGVLDFAGGTVVHVNAAAAALVSALVLGKRRGLRQLTVLPHNVPFAILGAGLLWFGWLGFNGGSALAANGLAAYAFSNTFFAPAAAGLAWGLAELLLFHGKMSGVGLVSGAVAGMVAITPAAGFVTPVAAIWIGMGAGLICYLAAVFIKGKLGYDDSLDAFGVHGVGGVWGALATGLFATKAVNPDGGDGLLRLAPHWPVSRVLASASASMKATISTFRVAASCAIATINPFASKRGRKALPCSRSSESVPAMPPPLLHDNHMCRPKSAETRVAAFIRKRFGRLKRCGQGSAQQAGP